MAIPSGYNNCEQMQSYCSTSYPVPAAALLWCGVPPDVINDNVAHMIGTNERGVYSIPYIPCFEPKCRAIHNAIESGALPAYLDHGRGLIVVDYVTTPETRIVKRRDLRAWIAKEFSDDKPDFLFDDKSTHFSDLFDLEHTLTAKLESIQAYQGIQVPLSTIRAEKERFEKTVQRISNERDDLLTQNKDLLAYIDRMEETSKTKDKETKTINSRSETTYLNIIGAMLNLMLSASAGGQKHSIFDNQLAIIDALVNHHSNTPGISRRTLESKFSEANKSLPSPQLR